jgi:hypothetical protein
VHLYDRKLPKASSVSLDRLLCILLPIDGVSVGDLPSIMFFWGALEVAPTTSGWSLASYASLLSVLFLWGPFRSSLPFSGPVCPFQCQALERWLELLPSRGCVAHSAGKRTFASCAKRHLLQLDASSRLLDAAAFNCCFLMLSLELASGPLPVPPF